MRLAVRFPGTFLVTFLGACFCYKLELCRASRRFSLLQTLCARRYEKRTQQADLVGKTLKSSALGLVSQERFPGSCHENKIPF